MWGHTRILVTLRWVILLINHRYLPISEINISIGVSSTPSNHDQVSVYLIVSVGINSAVGTPRLAQITYICSL